MFGAMKLVRLVPVLAIGVNLAASEAHASSVTLTFSTLPNEVTIGNYFNGGLSGYPNSGTGPNDGVVFSPTAEELKDTAGRTTGTGKFENNPSGLNGVLYFAFAAPTMPATPEFYLDDASGFNKVSFAYSLLNNLATYDGSVDLWSGLNGTGSLLSSTAIDAAGTTVSCTAAVHPVDEFCTWQSVTLDSPQLAKSITFGTNTTAPFTEFDEVTLTTTPLPASWAMMLTGLAGFGLFAGYGRLRRVSDTPCGEGIA
jgi:hypothetical protein